ncbi:hypothetical protein Fmac_026437 [Flemingia macrophylla]|uniref:Uncharacterized protein n=1 Tax=Flemingia macrophylla TaxID=520843 RepID=A0ABD1LF43_9FABA
MSNENFEAMRAKAKECEDLVEKKEAIVMVELQQIYARKNEVDKKVETNLKAIEETKATIETTLWSVEMADSTKAAIEIELMRHGFGFIDRGCYKKRVLFEYKAVNMKMSYLGMVVLLLAVLTIFSSSPVHATGDLSPPPGEAQPQPRLVRIPTVALPPLCRHHFCSPPPHKPSDPSPDRPPNIPDAHVPPSRPLRSSYFSHLHEFCSPYIPDVLIAPASSYSTTLVGASRSRIKESLTLLKNHCN